MPRSTHAHRALLVAAAFAAAAAAAPARAAVRLDPLMNDLAQYQVYAGDRLLGTEVFTLQPAGDSVLVVSNVDELIPTPEGDQRLIKKVGMSVKALDFALLTYSSETHFRGRYLQRGISLSDTTFTSYHEDSVSGYGDTMLRPPGRVYVIDSQVFALFDVLLRSLHGKLIDARTVPVILLSEPRDTVIGVRVQPGAADTIRWNARRTPTRRITISDGTSEFTAWVASAGRMLRLEQPATGLRVERDVRVPSTSGQAADSLKSSARARGPRPWKPHGR
jgi:hypothetical protein